MKSLSILLVDDDKIERLKFKKVCQKFDFESIILEAINGENALKLLEDYKVSFDLIVSDLNMPRMYGFQFLVALRSNPKFKYIPVVIMPTSESKSDLERCYRLGVSGCFKKPLKYSEYINKVVTVLEYWGKVSLLFRVRIT
ncbi:MULTISPECIES: response regulator [unclassified Polaribacter]|uniref:response regulator n=1 Tax=unclassified Polaribacter TaxID=196858 RepID=UPI0011BF13D4|nr:MULTISPECIES: response regulator [unclassified Polaribacter]TXD51357.1 response regulator [Polaribacter sp. IC063]TXD61991.1 response regulator [Polaribacter sp. IC066]